MKSVFIQALRANDKGRAVREAIGELHNSTGSRFAIAPMDFSQVPGSPFSYWVSPEIRSLFQKFPPVERVDRLVRQGGVTGNDARYLRNAWELPPTNAARKGRLVPFAKGGRLSQWYSDYPMAVIWDDGRGTFLGYTGLLHRPSEKPSSADLYFRPGLTWPLRASRFAPVPLPRGAIFSIRGYAILATEAALLPIAALGNSRAFDYIFKVALGRFGFPEFVVGVLQKVPLPDLSPGDEGRLGALARNAWSLKRSLDTKTETSHAFVLPALLQLEGKSLVDASVGWSSRIAGVEAKLAEIQAEIDERCFELYGINEEDRRAITEGFGAGADGPEAMGVDTAEDPDNGDNDDEADDADAESGADTAALAAELASWAVGVAFGRFDIRLATGDRPLPSEPEPFDPLPVCSPGMLTGHDGLPLARPPAGYPLSFPDDGILVDDPGHPRDLTAAVRAVFEAVFGSRADATWQEMAVLLDPRDHDLRRWLASGFFEHHLRRHSRSRRKAPIIWQFGIPSGQYSVWCYAHRMTRDSLLAIQNDIVGPKLATEERRLSSLVTQAGQTPSARERTDIATQQAFIDELRTLADEVRRVAPLWDPDLDDGIVLVMAPFWRLVPTHKAWQKELRTKWDELVLGKYDWAHIAMHLWPERVVPKCATDRSLAIAHGLEDVFWTEASGGKWAARKTPARPIAELIAERTSPTVRSVIAILLEAPGLRVAGIRQGGRRKG